MRPVLRFKKFSNSWTIISLGKLAKVFDGTHQTPNYVSSGVPFVSVEDISDLSKTQKFISKEDFEKNFRVKPQIGDILMTRITAGIIGATSIVKSNTDLGYYVSLALIKPSTEIDTEFLNYCINTGFFKKELHKRIIHVAFPKKINLGDINHCQFPFSENIEEQQKIASFLSLVDEKITKLKEKKELLEQFKKGVMQQIFSQELRFKDDTGEDFPEWEELQLSEVLYEHKTKNKDDEFDEVFSVAKHKGVINQIEHLGRSYSAKEISHYKVILPGDIVYTKSPTSEFPFGIIKQNRTGRTGVVSPLYGVFTPDTESLGFILHEYFLSPVNTYNYLNPLVQKGAKNTMNINNDAFLNGAQISLPVSEKEQKKIADFILTLNKKIELTENHVNALEVWKKGLLQQMFV